MEKIETQSLSDIVFERLEEMILSHAIQPKERINESKLSALLGVSRGPIREACRQLERHGMVEVHNRKGTFVKEINAKEVEEIYEIRAVLDQYAGEKAAKRMDEEGIDRLAGHIEEMKRAVKEQDVKRYFHANLDFHNAIFSISGNDTLPSLYESLIKRSTLFRRTSLALPNRLAVSLKHHQDIFSALASKNAAKSGQLMKDHVLDAKNALLDSLNQ